MIVPLDGIDVAVSWAQQLYVASQTYSECLKLHIKTFEGEKPLAQQVNLAKLVFLMPQSSQGMQSHFFHVLHVQ